MARFCAASIEVVTRPHGWPSYGWCARCLFVLAGVIAIAGGNISAGRKQSPKAPQPPERTAEPPPSPHEDATPVAKPSLARRVWTRLGRSWTWLLALFAFLSAPEGVVVFFSRRWDDWLSFHASRLVAIVPEDATPKTPKIAVDLRWLYRKMKRRFRGYVVFAAGLPALLPLRLVPTAGPYLFSIAATLWGWYWIGVFSAAKSAHAWADEERALSPAPIRTLNERMSPHFVFGPLRWYGRTWARLTRGGALLAPADPAPPRPVTVTVTVPDRDGSRQAWHSANTLGAQWSVSLSWHEDCLWGLRP